LTKQQSKSPRSPSSSFERLASPEAFGSNDDKDIRFDLDNLSPSVPLAWQRNFSSSPLKQYKFMWLRSRASEEEEEWNLRIVDKYPKVQRRETGRHRNAPERLTLSASHSSLDTDVSSSVSPSGYKEAAGLDQGKQLSLRSASKQAQWLPDHLQMPSNQTIAESFNRTKQSKLSWQVDKTHSAKLRLCLLCEKRMELEYCSKHPEKALHERVKLFCVHCWAGNNKQCKELLQVKGPVGMTKEAVANKQVYIDDTIRMLPEAKQVSAANGEDEVIQPMVSSFGLEVSAEGYSNVLKDHKLKFEPVLQQLLYDLHYFEKFHVIQHSSSTYKLTYAQIQPWRLCSCPHCYQCQNKAAAGPLQTRLHVWCDGCCDLVCECSDAAAARADDDNAGKLVISHMSHVNLPDDSKGALRNLILVDAASLSTVLLHQSQTGSLSVPVITTRSWHQEAERFCDSLDLEVERILQLAHPLDHPMADSPVWTVAIVDTGPQHNELSLRWCSIYSLPQIQNLQLYWSWEYFTPEESDQNSFAELPKNEQNRIQSTLRFLEEDAYSDSEEESISRSQPRNNYAANQQHWWRQQHW
jgi:hypothetical protein